MRLKKFISAGLLVGLCFLASCTKNSKDVYTNQNITKDNLIQEIGFNGVSDKYASSNYEIVDYDWLINTFYPYYQSSLYETDDVTQWSPSFQCSLFCEYYLSKLNTLYYKDHWNITSLSTQLAAGEFWYLPDPSRPLEGHSIVRIRTNKGWIFIDPQKDQQTQIVTLTNDQINSHYLQKF